MKIGLVGYQGGGKSTLFELLTGVQPDPAKTHSGQLGMAVVPDERFDRLVELYRPKKNIPAQIELFDTPGLSRQRQEGNPQKLGIIREAKALVQVIGAFAGGDPLADVQAFQDDLVLADLQVVGNRIERLQKDVTKPLPNRDELKAELDALRPLESRLAAGESLWGLQLTEQQETACKAFALLTRKRQLIVLNTAESVGPVGSTGPESRIEGRLQSEVPSGGRDLQSQPDVSRVHQLEEQGHRVVCAPIGLELELQALPEEEREEFAAEMGLGEPCRDRLLRAVFEVTDQIIFYTHNEKELRAWLLPRGATALDAAAAIHTDMARGFIRAEVMPADEVLRLGSEREVKAAGRHHVESKDYVVQDGDEILVRFNV